MPLSESRRSLIDLPGTIDFGAMPPLRPPPAPVMLTVPPTGSTVLPRFFTRSTSMRLEPRPVVPAAPAESRSLRLPAGGLKRRLGTSR